MSPERDPGTDIPAIALITYAGTRYFAVRVLKKTEHTVTCSLEHPRSPQWLFLLNKRRVGGFMDEQRSTPFVVVKHALRYVPEEKLESDPYEGAVYGYGGTVDAIR